MTHRDIYIKFMIGYDKANVTSSYPSLTEYEVATFLDKAYLALIAQKVTGNNSRHIGFEQDLKVTEDLGPLITTKRISGIDQNPVELSYVSNVLSCFKPTDPEWLYFVSGELKRGSKTWDMQLIDHRVASKFYTTAYNLPWIKHPVCYIEGNKIYTLYDKISQSGESPVLALTYIKMPHKFMIDDDDYTISNPAWPIISGYTNRQSIIKRIGDLFTINYTNGDDGEVLVSCSGSAIVYEQGDNSITFTAHQLGSATITFTNPSYPNWQFVLYVTVSSGNVEETWFTSIIGPDTIENEYNISEYYYTDCYSSLTPGIKEQCVFSIDQEAGLYVEMDGGIGNCRLRVLSTATSRQTITLKATSVNNASIFTTKTITVKYVEPQIITQESWAITFNNEGSYYSTTNEVTLDASISSNLGGADFPIFEIVNGTQYAEILQDLNQDMFVPIGHPDAITGEYHYAQSAITALLIIKPAAINDYKQVRLKISGRSHPEVVEYYDFSVLYTPEQIPDEPNPQEPDPQEYTITFSPNDISDSASPVIQATVVIDGVDNNDFTYSITSGNDYATINPNTGQINVNSSGTNGPIRGYHNITILATHNSLGISESITKSVRFPYTYTMDSITGQEPLADTHWLSKTNSATYEAVCTDQFGNRVYPVVYSTNSPCSISNAGLFEVPSSVTNPITVPITANYYEPNSLISRASASRNITVAYYNEPDPWVFGHFFEASFTPWYFNTGTFPISFYDDEEVVFPSKPSYSELQTPTVTRMPISNLLVYNGTDLVLLDRGFVIGGTFMYSTNNNDWSSTVPTGKNAGTFTVWYKVIGNAGYSDIYFDSPISVTISRKAIGLSWSNTTFNYDGNQHVPTVTPSGVVSGDNISVTVTGAKINPGTYTAYATSITGNGSGNYSLPAVNYRQFTISDMPVSISWPDNTYVIHSDTSYTSPVLNNPNNAPVRYSTSNSNVAIVDQNTGRLTIMGEGTCNIEAYVSGSGYLYTTASYVLNVEYPRSYAVGHGHDGLYPRGRLFETYASEDVNQLGSVAMAIRTVGADENGITVTTSGNGFDYVPIIDNWGCIVTATDGWRGDFIGTHDLYQTAVNILINGTYTKRYNFRCLEDNQQEILLSGEYETKTIRIPNGGMTFDTYINVYPQSYSSWWYRPNSLKIYAAVNGTLVPISDYIQSEDNTMIYSYSLNQITSVTYKLSLNITQNGSYEYDDLCLVFMPDGISNLYTGWLWQASLHLIQEPITQVDRIYYGPAKYTRDLYDYIDATNAQNSQNMDYIFLLASSKCLSDTFTIRTNTTDDYIIAVPADIENRYTINIQNGTTFANLSYGWGNKNYRIYALSGNSPTITFVKR